MSSEVSLDTNERPGICRRAISWCFRAAFSQLGLVVLVVVYVLLGAVLFEYLESGSEVQKRSAIQRSREECLKELWAITGGDDAELFRNRKGYMSINVQTISSSNLLITNIVARWPGSTHDSSIYQNRSIYLKFERGDFRGSWLLGDSGYPLKCHLLTPYISPTTAAQQRYNVAHIKTRNVVERQYGVLKRRFPVLALGLRLKLETSTKVILACSILHNLCILQKDKPINDGTIDNLETLITAGQIPQLPISDPVYSFQRSLITNYFENV